MGDPKPQSRLMVLMFTDIVGSVDIKQKLGDTAAAQLVQKHDELFRYTVSVFPFAEVLKDLGDGFLARFNGASDAVHAALHFQNALSTHDWQGHRLKVRIGLHLGEVSELEIESTTGKSKLSGLAVDITARIMSLALPGQILMTRAAFDNARQYVREYLSANGEGAAITRKWMAHGRYLFKGAEEPLEVFEVGEIGIAPLTHPPDTEKARRAVAADQEETLGWRPAVGLEIPDRKNWLLERKLGEGGFGEVWLGEHAKSKTRRVFKFCFDAERLRSFKRELMLFRLLRDALGDRSDIARLHEVQVDHAPFYLESEFTEDGSLVEWAQRQGGISKVPLATRLDIVARTAIAVSAAHSVGVLHKDIKPSNILIYRGTDGEVLPRLTDFGIGELTDPSQLANRNITMVSMTSSLITGNESSRTGTRMYSPPEMLMGKPFTIQGDVYALGVLLYQMVVGDLERPLAQGWERDVPDPLLRQDIARCVEGDEVKRLNSAKELADRLQHLPIRRRARQRRQIARVSVAASIVFAVLLSLAAVWIVRERRLRVQTEHEAEKAVAISKFLQNMLTSVDPRESGVGRDTKVVDKLDQAVAQLDAGELAGEPEIEAAVRWAIGNAYRAGSIYAQAEAQLQNSLDHRRAILSSPNLEIAQTLEDLGAIKWNLADYTSAEAMFRESMSMRQTLLGEDSLPVASSLNYLAATLDRMDQHEQAELLYRKALALRQRLAKGPERDLIARSMNNLATCLHQRGQDDEAEKLYIDAIDLVKQVRGPQHIDVANGLTNLAKLYSSKAEYDKALPRLLEALEIKRNILGNVHSSLAITLQALAELYHSQAKDIEAERCCREGLDVRRKVFREGHPAILSSLDFLAVILISQSKQTEAEPVLREALTIRSKILPQDHWEIADNSSRLGACLGAQGRNDAADQMLTWGYEGLLKSRGAQDAKTLDAANRLIAHYERTGRPEKAQALRQPKLGTNPETAPATTQAAARR